MKRVVYAGTPDFAVPALQSLIEASGELYQVVAVYTQPDRPAGRGRKLQASPVKICAQTHDIPVFQPQNFKQTSDIETLANLQPDLMVVAAYGLLLPKAVLETPKHGCVNLHASLLPRWRGAAPIQRAIEANDTETGITLMAMNEGLDTGNMLAKSITSIAKDETAQELHDRLSDMGAPLLMEHLPLLLEGRLTGEQQDENNANYARKLSKADAKLDWNDTAINLANKVRAMNPWPVCHTQLDEQTVRIWAASPIHADSLNQSQLEQPVGSVLLSESGKHHFLDVRVKNGALRIEKLQLAGSKAVSARDFLNARDVSGLRFE